MHKIFLLPLTLFSILASAHEMPMTMPMTNVSSTWSLSCSTQEVLNLSTGMCSPLPTSGKTVTQAMLHGHAFLTGVHETGPRGRNAFAVPNMLMLNAGSNFSTSHFFDVNLMLTAEKWTLPHSGYPELSQIGEADENDHPYIDAQHPHSSPLMGLTFSDTIRLTHETYARLSFAPRGETTEGPIAFMHRPTGMVNPDAPLGHHIGQDVGHISSTVLAGALGGRHWQLEVSGFNGREPEPQKVDLPLGPLNSAAARLSYRWGSHALLMASTAYVKDPESGEHGSSTLPDFYRRRSVSLFTFAPLAEDWTWNNALIYGQIENYDLVRFLSSWNEEFSFVHDDETFWARFEAVERTADQLDIGAVANTKSPHWTYLSTLGFTHRLAQSGGLNVNVGVAVSRLFLPREFRPTYGGEPWETKLFVQLSGMRMLSPSSMN